ncbi:hypothetical protein M9458_051399, partial [Cirrhinus mrigala]
MVMAIWKKIRPKFLHKAHGVLINHRDIKSDLSNLPTKPRPFFQKWIWMHFESPQNTRRLDGLENLFNVTLNYRRDADIVLPAHYDYMTEKLFNPLKLGSVPVTLGAPRYIYERFVPKDAFIHVKDFSSPQKLAEHLLSLDKN